MTYTPEQRKRMVQSFRLALKKIETEKAEFICIALSDTPTDEACKDLVMDRLDDAFTYQGWLSRHHPKILDATPKNQRHEKAREGRIAWLKDLIKEFEA